MMLEKFIFEKQNNFTDFPMKCLPQLAKVLQNIKRWLIDL